MIASRSSSTQELNQLIEQLWKAPGVIVRNAIETSDIMLIPVIALALVSRFKVEEDFTRNVSIS